ncbi:MAG: FadR/GntR family transcriptional regulator, partial [Candidatus Nanopelagicaceae bacterium]
MSAPIINTQPRMQSQTRLLLEYIDRENLSPGDRLTPERELAKKLGISRPSLREAIQVLQTQGRLMVRHGIGVFLVEDQQAEKIRESLRAANLSVVELFQMREILEAPAVEWA